MGRRPHGGAAGDRRGRRLRRRPVGRGGRDPRGPPGPRDRPLRLLPPAAAEDPGRLRGGPGHLGGPDRRGPGRLALRQPQRNPLLAPGRLGRGGGHPGAGHRAPRLHRQRGRRRAPHRRGLGLRLHQSGGPAAQAGVLQRPHPPLPPVRIAVRPADLRRPVLALPAPAVRRGGVPGLLRPLLPGALRADLRPRGGGVALRAAAGAGAVDRGGGGGRLPVPLPARAPGPPRPPGSQGPEGPQGPRSRPTPVGA